MVGFTCPFCYNVYEKRAIRYVCPDCNTESTPGKEPIKCQNPGCGGLATDRICPSCLNKIPRVALQTPNLSISMVGVSTSGKTNYITVMIEELMNFSGLRLAMGAQTNETRDHQNANRENIYIKCIPADATPFGVTTPQIWYIKNLAKKRSGFFGGNTVPTYTFSVYDGAGENYANMEAVAVRYVRSSDAFIITLDPLILEGVRAFVDSEVIKNSYKAEAYSEYINSTAIVEALVNHLKDIKGIPVDKPLEIPVAVVLTKFDTVSSHPSFMNSRAKKPSLSVNSGKVRVEEFDEVHNEIEAWLQSIKEQKFINTMDANFATYDRKGNLKKRHYKFFAVSSYGESPTEEGTTARKIRPHRVLDPMLWLFKKKNFID